MKSDNYIKDNLVEIRNKALQARLDIDDVISSIDNLINISNTQNMIIHFYQNGCSYKEIASRVGLSYTAVRKRCLKLKADGLID